MIQFAKTKLFCPTRVLYHQLDIINVPYNSIHVLHICMYDSVLPSQQNICSVIYWSFMVKLISVLVFIHALMDSSVQRQFLARIQQLKVSEAKKVSFHKRENLWLSQNQRVYLFSRKGSYPKVSEQVMVSLSRKRGFIAPSEADMVSLGKTWELPTNWEAKRVSLGKQRKLTTFSLSEARGEGTYYSKRQKGRLLTSREKLPHSQRQRG